MGKILKFPVQASKFGYKRARKRTQTGENPNQLHLFGSANAQILSFGDHFTWFEQALIRDERGDPSAADFYLKAIAEEDRVADAYCNLGIIESQTGNTTKAFDCFATSLKNNPRHSEAHYNLGNLYFDVNDLRLAQVHYEMAAEVDPAFANVHFNLALVQALNNELAAAVAALTKYQALASAAEGRNADELLHNLKKSLAVSGQSQVGTS
jgi:tetratricopeptide (TPR) repeat protein